jgi:hypothetical protein
MATCPAAWTRAKRLTIEGVTYDICIVRKGELFKSAWVCTRCVEQGPSDQCWPTGDEAAARAEIGSRIHHAMVHGTLAAALKSGEGFDYPDEIAGH